MSETSLEQQPELPPLDTKIKCLFQAKLMEQMGVGRGDHEAQMEWVQKYAKQVSDLIERDPEIRPLVEDKETWPQAIEKVREILNVEK